VPGRSFAPSEKFMAEVAGGKLRPGYVLIGDEVFFRDQCRQALLQHLVPDDLRDFSLHDLDLSEVSIAEVLDRARTPSLMAPFQVLFVRGVKNLYGRGSHADELAAIEAYMKDPNPAAVIIFVADHVSIPADVRRMDMQDKDRYERIRETLGQYCGIVELARVEESDGMRWIMDHGSKEDVKVDQDAARELMDALGSDMMLVSRELEKLILYVGEKKHITLGDVETMVLAAKQRSLYELTDAISAKDKARALAVLDALLRLDAVATGRERGPCNSAGRRRRDGCTAGRRRRVGRGCPGRRRGLVRQLRKAGGEQQRGGHRDDHLAEHAAGSRLRRSRHLSEHCYLPHQVLRRCPWLSVVPVKVHRGEPTPTVRGRHAAAV